MEGNKYGWYYYNTNSNISFKGSIKMKTPFNLKGVFSKQYS